MKFANRHIPVFSLHYVGDEDALEDLKPWIITKASLTRLLDYIEVHGYRTVVFEDLLKDGPGKRDVVLTFDDCQKALFDFAIPELLRRKMKAVFYMSTADIGGYNVWGGAGGKSRVELMDKSDLKRLISVGMEVGSHAHRHCMLSELDYDGVMHQLKLSKDILEDVIEKEVLSVAYPYGDVPQGYSKILADTGYQLGLSVYTPYSHSRFAIRRSEYFDKDDTASIKWKISHRYMIYRAVADKWDAFLKKSLSRLYNVYSGLKKTIISSTVLFYADYCLL